MSTKIEWAKNPDGTKGESLNIVTGCTKKSPGCKNCYAERMAKRLKAVGRPEYQLATDEEGWTGKIGFVEERLSVPAKWIKPRTVFLNSMSDTFHEDLTVSQVYRMLDMVVKYRRHVFIVVTKRPELAKMTINYFCDTWLEGKPIPNLWLLVSVENQRMADERIPHLLGTNTAVRGLSMEPLLGRVNIGLLSTVPSKISAEYKLVYEMIDWVIVGGESGHGARPMHPDWVRDIRDQCVSIGTPFFFKQWGKFAPIGEVSGLGDECFNAKKYHWFDDNVKVFRNNKKQNGRVLDGRTWEGMPQMRNDE